MGLEVLIAGASAMVAGFLANLVHELIRKRTHPENNDTLDYGQRLAELTTNLTKSSREVDSVLEELATVARNREKAVQTLEADLAKLEGQEKELKGRIEALENVPIPVAEHFAALMESGEKRGAKRDYILFGAGVGVTTAIALIIQAAF